MKQQNVFFHISKFLDFDFFPNTTAADKEVNVCVCERLIDIFFLDLQKNKIKKIEKRMRMNNNLSRENFPPKLVALQKENRNHR